MVVVVVVVVVVVEPGVVWWCPVLGVEEVAPLAVGGAAHGAAAGAGQLSVTPALEGGWRSGHRDTVGPVRAGVQVGDAFPAVAGAVADGDGEGDSGMVVLAS